MRIQLLSVLACSQTLASQDEGAAMLQTQTQMDDWPTPPPTPEPMTCWHQYFKYRRGEGRCPEGFSALSGHTPCSGYSEGVDQCCAPLQGTVRGPGAHFRTSPNICAGKKPDWKNRDCMVDEVVNVIEQAGADVTAGFVGGLDVDGRQPLTTSYWQNSLCPVNVHWHLGAEHRSQGQFDESGKGRNAAGTPATQNLSATVGEVRYGYACHLFDSSDAKFTKEYNWQHCKDMHVGETYEVHWPHSALGACHTPHQYQTPFYDGVFCHYKPETDHANLSPQDVANSVGVQAQVFTIVNDEAYYYPNLINGIIKDGEYGADIAAYTGSTTGTSRNNQVCSAFSPITWQVDRTCHLISASSFDKLCYDMKEMRDDMSGDLHPHGARELTDRRFVANNLNEPSESGYR